MLNGSSEVCCLKTDFSKENTGDSGKNAFGRTSVLNISASAKEGKTYLKELGFTAPFKVMTPFEQENGGMKIMMLMASAGIMEGDVQEISICTERGASLECTSQSFEKIHKMGDGYAVRNIRLTVGAGSFLDYSPMPVIPFADSAFKASTDIVLEDDSSSLIWQEIMACGRAARGERFSYRFYHSGIRIWQQEKLLYREKCRFNPPETMMEGIGLFEGYSHMASLLLFHMGISDELLTRFREYVEGLPYVCGGVTRTASGDVAVRIFSNQAWEVEAVCSTLKDWAKQDRIEYFATGRVKGTKSYRSLLI